MNERDIFIAALQIDDDAQRVAYIDEACAGDLELRNRLDALLEALHDAGSYLEQPPLGPEVTTDQSITEKAGTEIGPYKLLQQIGEGGMGVVYMAEQKQPVKRRVALKIIKPGMDTRQVIARFEAERQALAMMDHPNIAKVLDAGQTESGRPYFVMELVNGVPVTEYCDERCLTPEARLKLFVPICQAIQHAHQKGIIHRDLKPSNILVADYDHQSVPKVIDFGIAKATSQQLTEKTLYTQLGQIVGTVEYMSPEQAKRNQLDVDTRSDVYALGIVLYELLTGETPFERSRLQEAAIDEVLRIIKEEDPPTPSMKLSNSARLSSIAASRKTAPERLSALVRGDLDWIVMKALEKERANRYESTSALACDIEHYLRDEPVSASPPSRSYRFRRFARRHRVALCTATIVMVTVLLGLVGTSMQAFRATRAERKAQANAVTARRSEYRARKSEQAARASEQKAIEAAEAERDARAREESQRERAELVTEFMISVFRSPDPSQSGRKITVAEILDSAVDALRKRDDLAPPVRADLLDAIGQAYEGLGLYQESLNAYSQCLELRQVHLGPHHADTLAAMNLVALAHHYAGNLDEALRGYEKTLELRRKHLEPEHLDTIQSLNNLASVYRALHRTEEALSLRRIVLDTRKRLRGPDHIDTLLAANNLALTLKQAGKLREAIELLEETVDALKKNEAFGSPFDLLVMHNLGTALIDDNQIDRATTLLTQVLSLRTAALGASHLNTLKTMSSLGLAYEEARKLPESREMLEQAISRYEDHYAEPHPCLVTWMTNLGRIYNRQGEFDRAISTLEQALELCNELMGPESIEAINVTDHLADSLTAASQPARAVKHLKMSVAQRTVKQGSDHPDTLRSMNNLATAYWKLGQLDHSIPLFEAVYEVSRDKVGESHPTTLKFLANLGVNYRDAGRLDDAIECLEKAVALDSEAPAQDKATLTWLENSLIDAYGMAGKFAKQQGLLEKQLSALRASDDPPSSFLAAMQARLALCLVQQEKYAEAEQPLRDSLAIRETLHANEWYTFNTKSLLGECLLGQQRTGEAEKLLSEGYEGVKSRADEIPESVRQQRLQEAAARLVQLYDILGRGEASKYWQGEIARLQSDSTESDAGK